MAQKPNINRPTIVDVARLAGVSKSTVARALSQSSEVKKKTRDRVIKAADSVGYERNHLAHSLRSGRTGMLGLVIPDLANPFWAEVARGAQDRAMDEGVSLLVFSSDWNAEREAAHLRALRQARVDGALVNPVGDHIDELERFGMPVVLLGSSAPRFPDLPSVGSDINQGVRLGLDRLVALGHHAPALIVGSKGRLARTRFMRVVFDHCVDRDVDPQSLIVEEGEYTVQSGKKAMARILVKKTSEPMSVFVANDLMALGALLAVREAGLTCPNDVSILGFDGIQAGIFSDPGLSTVKKPARKIGEKGIRLLFDAIAGKASDKRIELACEMRNLGSLADISGTSPQHLTVVG